MLVARQTLLEALRLRLAALFVVMGIGLVLLALGLRELNFGAAELKFIADFGLGAIGLLGTLLAALAMAQLFFSDLECGFAACVLTKAVRRWEYLAGRLLGVMALLAWFVAGLGFVLGFTMAMRGAQLAASPVLAPVFLQACVLVWMKITVVAAMTLLVCSYAGSALFAAWAGLLLAAIAHLRGFAGQADWLNWLRLWPDLALFEVDALLGGGRKLGCGEVLGLGGYWLAFIALFTALATYVFNDREI
jgi:ABC-type transport system involved in multi-copper enzyme maturation permease subunit